MRSRSERKRRRRGAALGAKIGSALGSVIPGLGTAAGAAIGAAAGAIVTECRMRAEERQSEQGRYVRPKAEREQLQMGRRTLAVEDLDLLADAIERLRAVVCEVETVRGVLLSTPLLRRAAMSPRLAGALRTPDPQATQAVAAFRVWLGLSLQEGEWL